MNSPKEEQDMEEERTLRCVFFDLLEEAHKSNPFSQEGDEDFSDVSEEDVEPEVPLTVKKTYRPDGYLSVIVGEGLMTRSEVRG